MCFDRNSRKVPFPKHRKSLTWKCLINFFSNDVMLANVKVEFWDDKLSLINFFNCAVKQNRADGKQKGSTGVSQKHNILCHTFTGDGCGGFVFHVSWLTGFRHFIFGHQVLWDSQGPSADSQLKESISQLVI